MDGFKIICSSGTANNLCMHPNNRDAVFVVAEALSYVSRNRGNNWTNIASVTGGGQAHSFMSTVCSSYKHLGGGYNRITHDR
ncbi:MAG: hypothetical protein IPL16_12215 [Ignavibacteria bacterium]|nr:hypothetical protein [Ignavibacteria bacterium]